LAKLDYEKIPTIGKIEEISPLRQDKIGYPSTSTMSFAGMSPTQILSALAMQRVAGDTNQMAIREKNKEIEMRNNENEYRRLLANTGIIEKNRMMDIERQIYEDQAEANKMYGISSGITNLLASLAKIASYINW
jgi:fructose-1,6-bisphosphatase/sedoheptulose 1,7-bisphosphatase-like protein